MKLNHYRRISAFLGIMLAVVLTVGAAPAGDGPSAPQDENLVFSMLAQHIGTGPSGQTPVTITIERVNTPDERDALEEVFQTGGMQALADALRDATEVGFIRAPSISTTGWRLRYAMIFNDGKGGRIVRIATDRPISFAEAVQRRNATWDFNVSLIELVLDEEGNGTGTLMAGVEFAYDQTNDTFGLKSLSSQPVRLVDVRMQR